MFAENTKLIAAGLIALAIIQVAVVIVLIYLGVRVGDLSSEVDDLSSDVDGISSNVGGISSEVRGLSTDVEVIIYNVTRDCSQPRQSPNTTDCEPPPRPPPRPSPSPNVSTSCRDTLIFYDEFEYFNLTTWKHELTLGGGGNWEFQYYSNNRSNSYVKDGVLYIKPTFLADDIGEDNLRGGYTLNIWGSQPADFCTGPHFYGCERASGGGGNVLNPIRSARIRTAESFNFKYGRVEVKAQLPVGDWLWPAIWMLPTRNQYGTWPASGEIDIMESRGNGPNYSAGGVNTFGSTLHWGPLVGENAFSKTHVTRQAADGQDFAQDFHTYGLIWNETYIGTYLDDPNNTVLSVPIDQSFWEFGNWSDSGLDNPWASGGQNAPFDQEFYLLINLAVGGVSGYFPDNVGNKPWSDGSGNAVNGFWDSRSSQWGPTWDGEAAALKIDSVKVWCA